jgi:predicted nucleic-acid-binding protein
VIAADTNILTRYLTADDPTQFQQCQDLLEVESVWISRTVALELAWVLKTRFRKTQKDIANIFLQLLESKQLVFEEEDKINKAVSLVLDGLDITDAFHLISLPDGITSLISFDKALIQKATLHGFLVQSPETYLN